ncbi:hypothetical protein ACFE04_018041 [Oxalis oulophora]
MEGLTTDLKVNLENPREEVAQSSESHTPWKRVFRHRGWTKPIEIYKVHIELGEDEALIVQKLLDMTDDYLTWDSLINDVNLYDITHLSLVYYDDSISRAVEMEGLTSDLKSVTHNLDCTLKAEEEVKALTD